MKHLFLTIFLLFALAAAAQTAGRPDSTFGQDGIVLLNYGPAEDHLSGMALLPDNKIVLCANVYADSSTGYMDLSGLMRLMPDGTLDNSFSGDGMYFSAFTPDSHLDALAVQADGKIVAVGSRWIWETGETQVFLARFKTNGDQDLSFGAGGTMYTTLGSFLVGADAVTVQSDGKILVAGGLDYRFMVLRYLPNGMLDPAFGNQGVVTAAFSGGRLSASRIALLPDGKIFVGGNWWNAGTPFAHTVFARLLPDGRFDSTFAETGFCMYQIAWQHDNLANFSVLPNGQIVGAAECIDWVDYPWDYTSYIALFRLNADGRGDASFGDLGLVKTVIPDPDIPIFQAGVSNLAIQSDGKIVLAGSTFNRLLLLRYLSNGTLDSSGFGNNGMVFLPIAGYLGGAEQLGLSVDGKIVAAGTTDLGNGDLGVVVVRLLNDLNVGVLDNPGSGIADYRCYPNPLTSAFTLQYTLPAGAEVQVRLFEPEGRLLATLLPATHCPAGQNNATLRMPGDLPSGMYLLRLEAGSNGSVSIWVYKN